MEETKDSPRNSADTKDRVKVFIRWRPCYDRKELNYNVTGDGRQLHIPDSKGIIERDRWYKYDYIFPPLSNNKEIYKVIGHPLVQGALNGLNSSLFAYGQTGSGKTHTLMSKDGLTAHMISLLFSKIWNDCYHDYKITCSYLQIYQEKIYDLLNVHPNFELKVREDPAKGMFVENMVSYVCHTPTDVYDLLNLGRKRLVFAETRMNRLSSRSHAVCQIFIEKSKKSTVSNGPVTATCNTPVEISSPRTSDRPMPELSELEFETIPYIPTTLKKRHSIAVSMPTKRNSITSLSSKKITRKNPSNRNSPRDNLYPNMSRINNKRNSVQLTRAVSVQEKRYSMIDTSKISSSPFEKKPCLSASSSLRNITPMGGHNRLNIRRSSRPDNEAADALRDFQANVPHLLMEPRSETPDPLSYDTTMHSNISLASSRLTNSTDSVIDDMQWQMDASTADISTIFDQHSSTNDLLDVPFKEESTLDTSHNSIKEESTHDASRDSFKEEDISIEGEQLAENVIWKGKMSIVDLAGSERIKKSLAEGERLLEAQHINSTLHELGNVISALAKGPRAHVPYRNSTLTRLLQDSIGGNCKTSFVLCASGAMEDVLETKCTLEFGKRLLMISSKPKVNIELDYKKLCDELRTKMKESSELKEKEIQEYKTKVKELENQMKLYEEVENGQNKLFENLQTNLIEANQQNEILATQIEELEYHQQKKDTYIVSQDKELQKLRDLVSTLTNQAPPLCCDAETNTEIYKTAEASCNTTHIPTKLQLDAQTSPLHFIVQSISKSCNTSPITSPIHKLSVSPQVNGMSEDLIQRMRNILLTELMSLQLLYRMLDLKFNSDNMIPENMIPENEKNTTKISDKDRNSPVSSKSSGYMTSSQSQLDFERQAASNFKSNSSIPCSPLLTKLQDSFTGSKGGLLEEIIEAQLGNTKPESTSSALPTDRILILRKEIAENKISIDKELKKLINTTNDDLGCPQDEAEEAEVNKQDVYSTLVQTLADSNSEEFQSLEQLEQILDLILVDHSLTGCLLALSNKKKNISHEKMMRRLSSFKSTPKSLLDYIDVDEEIHGYENEAVVFHDNNENDLESEDGIVDYSIPDTPEMVQKRNDVIMQEVITDSEDNSDSELTESSGMKKKGLRRFLCMPMKSRKASMKKHQKPFKKAKKQTSGANLLEDEE